MGAGLRSSNTTALLNRMEDCSFAGEFKLSSSIITSINIKELYWYIESIMPELYKP